MAEPQTPALSAVVVGAADGATVVSVRGIDDPVFTAFQQEHPARVVVDVAGVSPGTVPEVTSVRDGVVEEVTVSGFEDAEGEQATRVELSLSGSATFDVAPAEGGLEIRITPGKLAESQGAETTLSSGTIEAAARVAPAALEDAGDETRTRTPARTLLGVEALATESGARILLLTDGRPDAFTQFLLGDPPRLVIDLPGFTHALATSEFLLDVPGVSRLRVGQHEGKVRVVLDGTDAAALANAASVADGDGVVIALGGGALPPVASSGNGEAVVSESAVVEVANSPASLPAAADDDPWASTMASPVSQEVAPVEEASGDAQSAGVGMKSLEPENAGIAEEVSETHVEHAADARGDIVESAAADARGDIVESAAADARGDIVESAAADAEMPSIMADAHVAPVVLDEFDSPAAHANGMAHLLGVQLDELATGSRITVLLDAAVEPTLVEPDAETVIVRLVGAGLSEDAITRIAPVAPGAVSLVTAFEQPGVGIPEVRVVIRRASGVTPTVTTEAGNLVLDFMTTDKVAMLPPAMILGQTANPASGAPPAAIDPDSDAIQILQEGGLLEGKQYTGRRVSLDFKDVDIDDVLRLVAEVSDLNIIAGDEVAGSVTIRLVDVPWDQALDVILLTKGLGFVRVGNVLRIAPSAQLKGEEEARLHERRAREKLEDLLVKLQPVNYANVKEVEKMVKRLLTPRGSVDVDKRTNTIILKDIASVIDEATALIKAIDTQTPQVLIEAKIVEANLDFSKEIGSQWSFGAQPFNDGFDTGSGSRQDLTIGGSRAVQFHDNPLLSGFSESLNNVSVNNPITSVPTGLLDVGAFLLDQKFNVELRLEAAESHGEGKVISSPRIVTLNNRKASIEQGVSIPFQTFKNGDAKLEFIDAVLRLEVTPHITSDRSILMKIQVQRNAPDDSVQTPTGSPAIAKNEAETETLVKDGQTLVIGGIYTIEKSERQSRVPYFHKIPILGVAFRSNEVRDIRKELLVFVTPRIVVNPELGS